LISQTNTATGDGSSFDQGNSANVAQKIDEQNKCGDSAFGDNNNAACQNSAISTVGSVSQTGGQSLEVDQNTEQINDCNTDSLCSNTADSGC
jgi:hypothetical protein